MHEFWEELEREIRPNFQGQITLHVQRGVVKNYELRQRKQPSSGFADIREDGGRRSGRDLTE